MSAHVRKQNILIILLLIFSFSCSREEESLYAENVEPVSNNNSYTGPVDYLTDIGTININVIANGNHPGKNDPSFLKNINSPNVGYCHPDVQYFPNGFNGYKYWMVFTPYFGTVGTAQDAKRYENPTIVVSNDGLNWSPATSAQGPLQRAPAVNESFSEKKEEPKQGFWSDVDWTFENNKFSLYYRGSFIKATAFKSRGAKNQNNVRKADKNAQRTIVRQTSADGIHWGRLEIAYTSNLPYSPKNNHIISPSFVYNGTGYVSYEVENNISPNFPGNDPSYVIRRTSANGLDFSNFKQSKVVNFINKPWAQVNPMFAPWHIQATYVDGYYFLCIAAGDVKKCTADTLYLAFSKDGMNFKVLPIPLVEHNTYRSCVFPMTTTSDVINFGAVIAYKTGVFKYREFQLNKQKIDECLSK
ncbi:hypothetical protein QE422_000886 [Chryseobacterium sp. SORGH_AS 447]|uniref:hypothetical protein n=1 Tax=Chryseobacterium sp. SORGH_AS_0447 TaxID=3041769 RepID=UPI0027850A8E|nr:hypothetical protein [Chryseobacterium sp. SORGH_AS_0447]MDQ1160518.1 hypothetical protein [Chryseobacterium sp. SORGH_AS_0447]